MRVVYKPEDGESRSWEFKRVRQSRAEMIEKRFGGSYDEFKVGIQQGNSRARRVLLWHLMASEHPGLRYEDTPDFYDDELELEYDTSELETMREGVVKAEVPDDRKEQALAMIDAEIETARAREQDAGVVGKAPSNRSGNATAS